MNICFSVFGENFVANVDYRVTHKGRPATQPSLSHPGEPPEAPEWEITGITLCRDVPTRDPAYNKPIELPKWLAELIENDDGVAERIMEEIADGWRR